MTNTVLYIDNKLCDLSPNTAVSITYQLWNIGDLKTRKASYTNQFKLPLTSNNIKIFGFSHIDKSKSDVPYRKLPAKIIQNGLEILTDATAILQDTEGGFTVEIYADAYSFFDLLGDKLLDDHGNGDPHPDDQDLLGYAAYNDGSVNESSDPLSVPTRLYIGYKDLLVSIIEENGYTAEGDIFTDENITNLILAGSVGYQNLYNTKFCERREFEASYVYEGNINVTTTPQKIDFKSILRNGGFYDGINTYEVGPNIIENDIYFYFNAYATVVVSNITAAPGTTLRFVLHTSLWDYETSPISEPGIYDLEISDNITEDPEGNPINKVPGAAGVIQYLTVEVVSGTTATVELAAGTKTWNQCHQDFTAIPTYRFVTGLLPPIPQKDFFKDFAVRTGCLFKEKNKVLYCKTLREIVADKHNAKDWTAKRDNTIKERISFQFGNYAQNNRFRYVVADDLTSKQTGAGNIAIDNETLTSEIEYFTSPFTCSSDRQTGNATAGFVTMAQVPISEDGEDVNDPGTRLLMKRDARSYEPTSSTVAYFKDIDGREGKDATWEHFIETFYSPFIDFFGSPKVITRYYNLTEVDIATLDLFVPIYDDGAYYIINKVYNYLPGRRTKVELIMAVPTRSEGLG